MRISVHVFLFDTFERHRFSNVWMSAVTVFPPVYWTHCIVSMRSKRRYSWKETHRKVHRLWTILCKRAVLKIRPLDVKCQGGLYVGFS